MQRNIVLSVTSICVFMFVSVQMLSPHNKGLIRRAISQSGVALCTWAVNRNPRTYTEQVTVLLDLLDSYYHEYECNYTLIGLHVI